MTDIGTNDLVVRLRDAFFSGDATPIRQLLASTHIAGDACSKMKVVESIALAESRVVPKTPPADSALVLPNWLVHWRQTEPNDADAMIVEASICFHLRFFDHNGAGKPLTEVQRTELQAREDELLRRAAALAPTDATALLCLVYSATQEGLPAEEQEQRVAAVLAISPFHAEALFYRVAAISKDDPDAAIAYARNAVASAPVGHNVHYVLAAAHLLKAQLLPRDDRPADRPPTPSGADAHTPLLSNTAPAAGQRTRRRLLPAEYMQSPQVYQDVLAAALASVCSPGYTVRAGSASALNYFACALWLCFRPDLNAELMRAIEAREWFQMDPWDLFGSGCIRSAQRDCGINTPAARASGSSDSAAAAAAAPVTTTSSLLLLIEAAGSAGRRSPADEQREGASTCCKGRRGAVLSEFQRPSWVPPAFVAAGFSLPELQAVVACVNEQGSTTSSCCAWCSQRRRWFAAPGVLNGSMSIMFNTVFGLAFVTFVGLGYGWALPGMHKGLKDDLHFAMYVCTLLGVLIGGGLFVPLLLKWAFLRLFWTWELATAKRIRRWAATSLSPPLDAFRAKGGIIDVVAGRVVTLQLPAQRAWALQLSVPSALALAMARQRDVETGLHAHMLPKAAHMSSCEDSRAASMTGMYPSADAAGRSMNGGFGLAISPVLGVAGSYSAASAVNPLVRSAAWTEG